MVTSRIWFTPEQKTELWERWKQGHSISAISRALERRNKTGVQRIVALHGGIAPPPRHRAASALQLEEREEISRGLAAGRSIRGIAGPWAGRLRRSAGRSSATVACGPIVRRGRTSWHGNGGCVRSGVAWPVTDSYVGGWRKSWRCSGRRSRLRVG